MQFIIGGCVCAGQGSCLRNPVALIHLPISGQKPLGRTGHDLQMRRTLLPVLYVVLVAAYSVWMYHLVSH